MGRITLEQAAQWCGGQIDPKYKNVTFFGANNDTRKLEAGELFVVLQGARDGHDFIPAALEKGAAAVLCNRSVGDFPAILVPDVRAALGQIAMQERIRLGMQVVGVTGSVGKTTTKEMIASLLGTKYRVQKTPVNHNNDIGMPMAILAMPEDTEIAVLEMGMNHFREIAYLSNIAKPEVGVITNIGTMHIEHLGSREGILKAKMEILEGMPSNGTLVLNGDDSLLCKQWDALERVIYFGSKKGESAVTGEILQSENGKLCFAVTCDKEDFTAQIPMEGEHYMLDALAAIAVAQIFEVPADDMCKALFNFQNAQDRQETIHKGGYTVIKDCYNAGPESMAALLNVLHNQSGRRIAVLGDMLELGECAPEEHRKVGALAAQKADLLFAFGPNGSSMAAGAVAGGMLGAQAFLDRDMLYNALVNQCVPGDVLLFKGSRGMRMELIADAFLQSLKTVEDDK